MRAADLRGPTASAWKLKKPAPGEGRKDWEACIESWILNGPGYHPAWAWWQISVVSLRDIPGVPPAKKDYHEAEYEFMIIALNPEKGTPDIDLFESGQDWGKKDVPKFLFPVDVTKQFHGVTEMQVAEICTVAVKAIVNGYLSPDQDFRSAWNYSIDETVKHMIEGRHDGAKVL